MSAMVMAAGGAEPGVCPGVEPGVGFRHARPRARPAAAHLRLTARGRAVLWLLAASPSRS